MQSYVNVINNYYISGPSTSVTAFTRGNANFHACTLPLSPISPPFQI